MEKMDMSLTNGRLVSANGIYEVDIAIHEGRISAISERGRLPEAREVIDARGKFILPGGIDTHVHSGGSSLEEVGTRFGNATRSAALGGITTIVDMPVQVPLTTDVETFDQKLDQIEPHACVDFALWGTCKSDDLSLIAPLSERGVVGFKLVMQKSTGRMPYHDDGVIHEALQEIKDTGLIATIHAESQAIISRLEKNFKNSKRMDPRAFLECHPIISELEAINRILFIADAVGARINIAHCSIAEGVDLVDQAKMEGRPVTVETCVHYLILDESIFDTKGVFAKLSPALRDREHVNMMWDRIRKGKVDCVASDHVPYTLDFKKGNIWEASAGIPGIQTMFPLLVSEGINKDVLTWPQMAKIMSEGPAKVCGLYPKKGSIMIGADADLAVFDPKDEREIRLENQIGLQWTLYEGYKAVCPETVILRGKKIVEEGQIVGEPGFGKLCVPKKGRILP